MVEHVYHRLNASDRSYFAILKKEIHALALSIGFTSARLAEIDIVVAEMVSNLTKHAVGGQLLVKKIQTSDVDGIEILCIDEGPGLNDVHRMMQDGVSTKNTLGHGLGAIKRLADVFQVYSQKGWGTIFLTRFYKKKLEKRRKAPVPEIHSLIIPKTGETLCGDGAAVKVSGECLKIFLGDGLGHGKEAFEAVQAAIAAFMISPELNAMDIIRDIHYAVKKSRGLVATVAIFFFKERKWKMCGVGNIVTKFHNGSIFKTHASYNGIIGHNIPNTMKDTEVEHSPGQIISLASDGIRSRWETVKHPALMRADLGILNAAVFKDFARESDDMSIVSCKLNL
jgi:anti-sigma regulatory factor (Ser/Thr protein kinase)